jgi:hypothetical protein
MTDVELKVKPEVKAVLSKYQAVCRTYFSLLHFDDVASNDTQYDITSLEKAFVDDYKRATGKAPPSTLFFKLLKQTCRPTSPQSDE